MSEETKIERASANENPWYWLATVYGEQATSDGSSPTYDFQLAKSNRLAWNRWMSSAIDDSKRAALLRRGFDKDELTPFLQKEREQFLQQFAKRAGVKEASPPEPNENVGFRDVYFECPANFANFLFPFVADFRNTTFSDVSFMNTAFCGPAVFREASFHHAFFSEARFWGEADFFNVTLAGEAGFSETRFCQVAMFSETRFRRVAQFNGAAFLCIVSFSKAVFSDRAEFTTTRFRGATAFQATEFKGHTRFTGARFLRSVPDFRDAKMSEATEWHGVTWPSAPKNKDAAQQQVYAYEKLKAEMERLKKHADEQMFFAKELRARRALAPSLSLKRLFYFAYEQFGGYGQSVVRPLVSLAILWALGAGLFALLPAADGWPLDYEAAARLSFTNLIPFLPYKLGEAVMNHLEAWAKWLGILQAILGAALLFLFGLALRNLFRMK